MSQFRDKLDSVYDLYVQGKPGEATRAAAEFLANNPDHGHWSTLIDDCVESKMLGFLKDISDQVLPNHCFDFHLHLMMANTFLHSREPIYCDAWLQKYRETQGDTIVRLADEGRVDEAAAKFTSVLAVAWEDPQVQEYLFGRVCSAGNRLLLNQVAEQYDGWNKLDTDLGQRLIGQLRANAEFDLASQCLTFHIDGNFLETPSATRLLMEILEEAGDHDQAERTMKLINEHVTEMAGTEDADRYLGELAPTYAIFARMGAARRENSRTRAIFEQALELTEVGCSGKAWCQTLRVYADWLDSVGETEEASWQRSRIVSAPERYADVDALISRWLVTRTGLQGAESHQQLNLILDQLEHPNLVDAEINRLLPLLFDTGDRHAVRTVCNVLWHNCIEDGCCPVKLGAWLIAVNHNGLISDYDDLKKQVELGYIGDCREKVERYAGYVKCLLTEDFAGAEQAAEQMLATESVNPTSDGTLHARQLLAYSALRQDRHKVAARHYQELLAVAQKNGTPLHMETWEDAAMAFKHAGVTDLAANAQENADDLRRGALSLKEPAA